MQVPETEVVLRFAEAELARVTLPAGKYVIGRSPEVAIFADTPLLSRQHARLTIHDDHVLIEDLGSSNGSFVNEQPITAPTRLSPGQPVRLGDVQLEIRQAAPPGAPAGIARFLPPEILAKNRYGIGAEIARGGMGAILGARQKATQRHVAMKIMLGATDQSEVVRFIEEAQVTAQLDHPNIVPIYELGVDEEGRLYYTMKMVSGITLKKILELRAQGVRETVKKYPLAALLTVFQKVCDALAFAHSKGVLHRDLKPENIMLGDFGSVLVMDWGLAKVLGKKETPAAPSPAVVLSARAHGDSSHTLDGTIMGTPAYMSPEQARGEVEALDARSDLYSLGMILFEILHLRPALTGRNVGELLAKARGADVEWAAEKTDRPAPAAHLPASLLAVCRKALVRDRAERYASVEDLQRDLAAYQSGFATSAERAGWMKRASLAIKRNKTVSLAAALLLGTGVVLGTHAVLQGRRAARALSDLRQTAPMFAAYAQSLVEEQRFEEALTALQSAMALDPHGLDYQVRAGHVLQTLQRFPEAEAAYRLAMRSHRTAEEAQLNLELTQSIAREAAGGAEAAKHAQAKLQSAVAAQGRTAESIFLGKDLADDGSRNRKTWLPVLKAARMKADTTHFRSRPDGTLFLYVERGAFSDLRPLVGMPLSELRIAGTSVADLSPLKGMPLRQLDLSGMPLLTDLNPLKGMRLEVLKLQSTDVIDLSPLEGMPLVELSAAPLTRSVSDLKPLEGMPLQKLYLRLSKTANLEVLSRLPRLRELTAFVDGSRDVAFLRGAKQLTHLSLHRHRGLVDISALAGKPLVSLYLAENPKLADISPLRGLPLEELHLSGTSVTDLSPLAGMPLRKLSLANCQALRDLRVLATIPTLESVIVPTGDIDLTPLRRLPNLKRIGNKGGKEKEQATLTAAEFWAAYDASRAAGKK